MGSLHRYKGVDVFLKSLRAVRGPFQAVVAGKFKDESERSSLLSDARLGDELASSVVFTGGVSNEELRALYHLADLFVYPTLADSLPLVVLEAMACGLPVVSTTVGGIPFAVRPEAGVLVPPGDVTAVSMAVNDLLADPSRRRAMAPPPAPASSRPSAGRPRPAAPWMATAPSWKRRGIRPADRGRRRGEPRDRFPPARAR